MRIRCSTLFLLTMMSAAHASDRVDSGYIVVAQLMPATASQPVVSSRGRDPWVVGLCASDEARTAECYSKSRDRAVQELTVKTFQKAVDNYFKARPIRNFFDNTSDAKRKDDELRATIDESQEKALPDIQDKVVRTMAAISPSDNGADAMREQVDSLVMRMALEVGPAIERAAEKSPYHRPASAKAMPKR